jgi:hypothetical protein
VKKRVSWKGAAVQRGLERGLLLETVTSERLVKTQQAGEGLVGAMVIFKV